VTILTHFTFESPIRKLCLRCCQSQLGIHFRTPLSGTWISQGKITAFLVAVLRSAFLHRESGDDPRFVFVKDLKAFLTQVAHRMMLCTPPQLAQYLIDFDFNLEGGKPQSRWLALRGVTSL
jgi:hypothetical protein